VRIITIFSFKFSFIFFLELTAQFQGHLEG